MSFYHFNNIAITGIASAVPKNSCTIVELNKCFDANSVNRFIDRTGFQSVRHSIDLQTASDLGFEAANQLLNDKNIDVSQIGFIIFISKTPDYRSPATAIVLQHRLQLSKDCLAYDVNLGSVGFAAGLQLGCSILSGLNTGLGLIIIGDTNSKQLNNNDINSMILGDAATAILLEKKETPLPILIQQFSNGENYDSYIVPQGAFRTTVERPAVELSSNPNEGNSNKLIFDSARMHQFYSSKIPKSISGFLIKCKSNLSNFDVLAFQQSNIETLKEIAQKLEIDYSLLQSNFKDFGDVSGSSVSLLLRPKETTQRVLSCSFGEGFSWAIADFYLEKNVVLPIIETDNYFDEGFVTHEM